MFRDWCTAVTKNLCVYMVAYSIRGNDSSMTIHLKTTTKETNK